MAVIKPGNKNGAHYICFHPENPNKDILETILIRAIGEEENEDKEEE